MKAFALCQQLCPELLPVVGDQIGHGGADGEVFILPKTPDRVIKFSIIYDYPFAPYLKEYERINDVLTYLVSQHPDTCVRVHSHCKLAEGNRQNVTFGDQKYLLYCYVMDKCFSLSEEEKKVFHSIISPLKKFRSTDKSEKILIGLSKGFDFDIKKIMSFVKGVSSLPFTHSDLSVLNIMNDIHGNLKLIDFDRAKLEK
jgi:thiamine kinase-like enzyme